MGGEKSVKNIIIIFVKKCYSFYLKKKKKKRFILKRKSIKLYFEEVKKTPYN